MLAVQIFLLEAEPFYGSFTEKQRGKGVSCNTICALHTFAKKSKRVSTISSNTDVMRTLREVNRRANKTYRLEHM